MKIELNGKHMKVTKAAPLPEGSRCMHCGALVPAHVGICDVQAEYGTAVGCTTFDVQLCRHCEALWTASRLLSEWVGGLAIDLETITNSESNLENVCVIPKDRSLPAAAKRLRLLNDAAMVCRNAFLAMGSSD